MTNTHERIESYVRAIDEIMRNGAEDISISLRAWHKWQRDDFLTALDNEGYQGHFSVTFDGNSSVFIHDPKQRWKEG